jgi:recombinational DNA repair ATPase RecF
MKIHELEIKNIRGIPYIDLKPCGKNFLIFGPNGTGKSAIIDAIDFLLTGDISRFRGEGTGEISLIKHGHHISHDPKNAEVRALIKISEVPGLIEIKRRMKSKKILEYDKKYSQYLDPIIEQASRGQHILTRRDLLKFIVSKPQNRAAEIQTLLNITEIENVRKALMNVKNSLESDLRNSQLNVNREIGEIKAIIQKEEVSKKILLDFVNTKRKILKTAPLSLSECNSQSLKKDILPLGMIEKPSPTGGTTILTYLDNLLKINNTDKISEISLIDCQLRDILKEIKDNPDLLRSLSRYELTKIGIQQIDESGACPLCDTQFPPGDLISQLERKLALAQQAKEKTERIGELIGSLIRFTQSIRTNLNKVNIAMQELNVKENLSEFLEWEEELTNFESFLEDPSNKFVDLPKTHDEVIQLLSTARIQNNYEKVCSQIQINIPNISPEQKSWDTLTQLELITRRYKIAQDENKLKTLSFIRSVELYDSFLAARDEVLENLYDSVKNRFVELYRKMHGTDETQFNAQIGPSQTGAGLAFEVAFLDNKYYPPQALHSEGHQDSMGLCLFLALFEQLNEGIIDLIILDDIVMSVDTDHRKAIGKILVEDFPNQQFFITTHDRAWMRRLRFDGVITPSNILELYNWNLECGPQINCIKEDWDTIFESVTKNNVPEAAAKLRRGSEEFFTIVCESIRAEVPLKSDGQWDLGEVLHGAMSRYKEIVSEGNKAAKSWKNTAQEKLLMQIEAYRINIAREINSEQWTVNPCVHYNNWANFSQKEFIPVVEAFRKLWGLFICDKCGSIIYVVKEGSKDSVVRCNCNDYNWNLVGK